MSVSLVHLVRMHGQYPFKIDLVRGKLIPLTMGMQFYFFHMHIISYIRFMHNLNS